MTWTALSFSYGSVLTSSKMTQLFDNFAAMAAGNAGSPALTTTQVTTQAVGNNTTAIATTAFCEAGFVNNDNGNIAVGGFWYGGVNSSGLAAGSTISGASLYYLTVDASNAATMTSVSLAGTWRNVSGMALNTSAGVVVLGMLQRIS